jgi:hypothetical protein
MGRPAHLICSISACPVCTDLPTAAQKQNPPKSPTLPPPPPPPFFLVRLRRSRSLLLAAYRPRPLPQPSHRRRRHVSEQSLPAPPLRYAEKASLLSRKNFFDPPAPSSIPCVPAFEFATHVPASYFRARVPARLCELVALSRADRPVHRIQDLGDHEGRQGARRHPLRVRRLRQHGPRGRH